MNFSKNLYNCLLFLLSIFIDKIVDSGKLPLIEDNNYSLMMTPKISQQTQCVFDKTIYEIGDKWHPNIEPFGYYYCILCECIAVQRKKDSTTTSTSSSSSPSSSSSSSIKMVMAKVQCKNFKNECPKPSCENPILLPERCCKSCPGEKNLEDLIASQKMEEQQLMKQNFRKKFFALLSVSSSSNGTTPTTILMDDNVGGKAYFHINKQRLAFLIKIKSFKKPTMVRFQDLDDTIIEEYIVLDHPPLQPQRNPDDNSDDQDNDDDESNPDDDNFIVFGSWLKVPKPYRSMLRRGHLKISISFNQSSTLTSALIGLIRKSSSSSSSATDDQKYFELISSTSALSSLNSMVSKKQNWFNTTSLISYEQSKNSLITGSDHRKSLMMLQQSDQSYQSINSIETNLKCYYEAEIYDDGLQWQNLNDDCEMCSCQRGRVKCETEICLKLRCKEQLRLPGQCCPICKNKLPSMLLMELSQTSSSELSVGGSSPSKSLNQSILSSYSCYFEGDKKYHLIGTRWHPYIPPFGFDKCTICSCITTTNINNNNNSSYSGNINLKAKIKCKRFDCPPLPCAERDAFRDNPMDCCKKCRAPTRSMMLLDHPHHHSLDDEFQMNDQAQNQDDLLQQTLLLGNCRFRGKIYKNGDEWHPTVDPYGEINCIKCFCKDGLHKCQRIKCKTLTQGNNCQKIIKKGECCPQCIPIQTSSGSMNQSLASNNDNNDDEFYGRRRVSTKTTTRFGF